MWCFFDESFPPEGGVTAISACLMQSRAVRELDRAMFVARRAHFGADHAKDLAQELKGATLLSKQAFIRLNKTGASRNHSVVEDVFNSCIQLRSRHPIYLFGTVIYGARSILASASGPRLDRPLMHMLNAISAAACRINFKDRVNIVLDEQIGSRADVAIRMRQFIAGVGLKNVSHYPLSAVSNVSPGLQLADIAAYILGRQAMLDRNFGVWMSRVRALEWRGRGDDGRRIRGLRIFQQSEDRSIQSLHCWGDPGA